MESLAQHLDKLLETLDALDSVLAQEYNLLCAGPLPGVALQRITDGKSQLLATVNYLEQRRLELEHASHLQAPYAGVATLAARWQQIQQIGQRLRDSNQHNGLLLSRHIEHNAAALTVLNRHNKTLYGPDGQSRAGSVLGRKIGV